MNSIGWYKSEYFLPISHRMTGCVSAAIIQKVIYFMIVFLSDRHRQGWVVWPSQSVYLFFSPKRLIVFLSVHINTFWSHKTLLRVGSLEEIIETKREREREEECVRVCVCAHVHVCVHGCVCVCVCKRERDKTALSEKRNIWRKRVGELLLWKFLWRTIEAPKFQNLTWKSQDEPRGKKRRRENEKGP